MKLVLILNDAGMAANIGGSVATQCKIYPMPDDVAKQIREWTGDYSHVLLSFAKDDEEPKP